MPRAKRYKCALFRCCLLSKSRTRFLSCNHLVLLLSSWLQMSVGFQPLRTPTMLSGAPAALVSYCQRHGRAAMCFAAAELPGRRAVPPHQQQLDAGGEGGSSGGSLIFAERSLSCTRKPLAVVAGEAMVSGACGGGEGAEQDVDAVDSATSSLYI